MNTAAKRAVTAAARSKAKALERDMNEAAKVAYGDESGKNIFAFWEAFKAFHVANGELIEAMRNEAD